MMTGTTPSMSKCDATREPGTTGGVELHVLPSRPQGVRKSKNGPRRAAVLIAVHVLMIGHILHWWITGRTVSPVEPSEAMYTLNQGHLNAGFIFFGVAILATLVFGRFFCGWGCHLVAYQDFCAWLMKKAGVKPKAFRSRLLVLAPLALALYMFVWPTVYRVYAGMPAPELTNHTTTAQFWKTFPGPVIAVITFAVCGFAIIYFLGAKGFCTYACPYGGFFGVAERAAPGRIRVTSDCEQCGHCTAVCTSNVRVHEEVAKFGMVVDPGCMKCMDCVSVCPNDALYFGFAKSPTLETMVATQVSNEGGRRYDFTLAEEIVMAVVGVVALLAYRGLYGQIPLLLAMGMAAISAFVFVRCTQLVRQSNVKLQNRQLKRGGTLTGSGRLFVAGSAVLFVFAAHSLAVQYQFWQGRRALESADIGDAIWRTGADWWHSAGESQQAAVDRSLAHFQKGEAISLMSTPGALQDMIWLLLARGDVAGAESTARRLTELIPGEAEPHRGLANIVRMKNHPREAEESYRKALQIDPSHDGARTELATLLLAGGRLDDAVAVLQDGEANSANPTKWKAQSAHLLAELALGELNAGRGEPGIALLREALSQNPSLTQARYNLALALLSKKSVAEAIEQLQRVVAEKPDMAEAQYNLAVAIFMSGRPADAVPHAEEALRLAPNDEQAMGFLKMLKEEMNR